MTEDGEQSFRLDVAVAASGFKNEDQQALEDVSSIDYAEAVACSSPTILCGSI